MIQVGYLDPAAKYSFSFSFWFSAARRWQTIADSITTREDLCFLCWLLFNRDRHRQLGTASAASLPRLPRAGAEALPRRILQ